jgi:hypothetical protein
VDDTADAILDADLPSALQVTLLHMHRASEEGLFVGTQQQIADERGVSRGTVASQVKDLKDRGWLRKVGSAWKIVTDSTEREDQSTTCRESKQSVDSVNTEKGFPLSSLPFSPKKVHSTPFEPALLSPSQSRLKPPSASSPRWLRPSDRFDSIKEPIPEDHPARWDHLPGDWTFEYASAALEHFREFDLLATPTKNKIDREGEDYVISQWADTFRLLNEQDGYPKDEILATMKWLFSGNNFWIDKQAIRSVPPLRSKTSSGDAYKFDMMHQNAHEPTQTSSTGPGLRMPQEEKELTLEDVRSN